MDGGVGSSVPSLINDELNWQVEEACREAWPAETSEVSEGWLFRRSGGRIRRTNSVNPLPGKRGEARAAIDGAEAFYARHSQAPIFRVLTIADELESILDRDGYVPEAETAVLFGELVDSAQAGTNEVTITIDSDEAWFEARARMNSDSDHDLRVFRQMVRLIKGERAFASTAVDGQIISVVYGVICNGVLVLEAVETDTRFRGRGLASRTIGSLFDWARRKGASACGLQCVADNLPARALYASLGLRRELYRYHYRRKAIAS